MGSGKMNDLPEGFVLDPVTPTAPVAPSDLPAGFSLDPVQQPQSTVSAVAGGYLSNVADAAKSGLQTIAGAFQPSQADAASMNAEKNASPFDISGELSRLASTGGGLAQIGKGIGQVLSAPVSPVASPVISSVGNAMDYVLPRPTGTLRDPIFGKSNVEASTMLGNGLPTGADILNTASAAVAPSAASPVGILTKPASANLADVKAAATSVYNDPAVLATKVHPYQIGQTISDLNTPAFAKFNATDEPAVFRVIDEIKQAATGRSANGQAAPRPTVNQLNIWSERLGKYAGEVQANGQPTPQAFLASNIKNKLDSLLENAAPGWAAADQNYAAAATAKGLNNQSIKAEIKARGGDYAEKLGQAATKLLQDPKVVGGLAPDDLAALQQISQGSVSQNALSRLSNLMGSKIKHGVGLVGGALLGHHFGGGETGMMLGAGAGESAAIAAQSAATAARNAMAKRQLGALTNSILSKAPYVQSLPPVPLTPNIPLGTLALGNSVGQGLGVLGKLFPPVTAPTQ